MRISRRLLLAQFLALPLVALVRPLLARAQVDQDWLRMWLAAQKQRPANIGAAGRIAAPGEPGLSLALRGRVVSPDGRTPATNAIVFAYQTDATGVYSPPGQPAHWRLQGWTRCDAQGRFEFATIRPAPYPNRQIAAHIHLSVESARYGRQYTEAVLFDDDVLVTADEQRRSRDAGAFGFVRPVEKRDGVQHVEIAVRLKAKADF